MEYVRLYVYRERERLFLEYIDALAAFLIFFGVTCLRVMNIKTPARTMDLTHITTAVSVHRNTGTPLYSEYFCNEHKTALFRKFYASIILHTSVTSQKRWSCRQRDSKLLQHPRHRPIPFERVQCCATVSTRPFGVSLTEFGLRNIVPRLL